MLKSSSTCCSLVKVGKTFGCGRFSGLTLYPANRQVGATMMNEYSSRSHTIFKIQIKSRVRDTDRFVMIANGALTRVPLTPVNTEVLQLERISCLVSSWWISLDQNVFLPLKLKVKSLSDSLYEAG